MRHINILLSVRGLQDIGFISYLSEERRRASKRNLENKRKFTARAKKTMVDRARDANTLKKKHRIRLRDLAGILNDNGFYLGGQVVGNLLEIEKTYEDKREKYEKLKVRYSELESRTQRDQETIKSLKADLGEVSASYWRSKAECQRKHAKLLDYRKRIEAANDSIRVMKCDLGYNAVNLLLVSDEFYNNQMDTFDLVVEELKSRVLALGDSGAPARGDLFWHAWCSLRVLVLGDSGVPARGYCEKEK
ncbi:hypothetical protein Dsin_000076 [Dipteronia sinensis]|uniref:Uncharacterized protein n=1 Tax=Dipteronia sinensis TaxID=43782 RepID=A0AAD9ZI36_9ROSI|nr:hypothetical protein Dsin_000076 [Dipteronia sinensis]